MGKKKQPVERVTLTVPADIRRQMKKHEDVNWSSVASNAFSNHLSRKDSVDFMTFPSDEPKFIEKWAAHRRGVLKAAVAEIRDIYPNHRISLFESEEDKQNNDPVFPSRDISLKFGNKTYTITIHRSHNEGCDFMDVSLYFTDEDCVAFGDYWPDFPTEPKAIYELLAIAGRSTLILAPHTIPTEGISVLGIKITVPALSVTGQLLLDVFEELGPAMLGVLELLSGENDNYYNWNTCLTFAENDD